MRQLLVQFVRDVRQAARSLARRPGLVVVVVGSLGLGIGVNTTVFSWLQSRLLEPIPGAAAGARALMIEPRGESGLYTGTSWLEYRDLRGALSTFEAVIAFRLTPLGVGLPDRQERTTGTLVSGNYFQALGVAAARGRLLDERDETTSPVAVVSHAYWRSQLAGDEHVVGRTLRVNDRPFTIVGVAAEAFQGTIMGLVVDLWVPATVAPVLFDGSRELESRGARGYGALGLLRSGATRAEADAEAAAAMRSLAQAHPDTNAAMTAEVLPLWQAPRGPQRLLTTAVALLQAVMLLVLLVVCGNTANLMLARTSTRRSDTAIRLALGAGRWRIVSGVVAECLLLGAAGAVAGALAAVWGTEALRAVPMPTPGGMTVRFQTGVNWTTVAFAMSLGCLSALAFGLPPALQLARADATRVLRSGGQARGRSRLSDVLMVVEAALATIVLAVAVLFLRSFAETQSADPGFRREGVLLSTYDLRGRARDISPEASRAFVDRLLDGLRAMPEIEAAAVAASVPLDIHGMGSRTFVLDGRVRPDGEPDRALSTTVTPGYLATMGIPLRQGADFDALADAARPPQAIVNETFVRRFLDGVTPIGRTLEHAGRRYTIVGVVADSLYEAYGEAPTPFLYLSYRDRPVPQGEVHVRARDGDVSALASLVRRAVAAIDPTLPVYNVRTLRDHVDTNLIFRRIPARLFAVLAPIVVGLAAMGIYAVVSYGVAERRGEMALRLAVGARGSQVVGRVVGESLQVVGVGVASGWIVAVGIERLTQSGAGLDPAVVAAAPLALVAAAAAASWLPARRAASVHPSTVLKQV
jgi:predicted permease